MTNVVAPAPPPPAALLEKIECIRPVLQGWCSAEKAAKLASYVVHDRPDTVVEIGVFGGASLIPLAIALRHIEHGRAYGIDPWSREAALEHMLAEENRQWWDSVDLNAIYNGCAAGLHAADASAWCDLIRDKAENVVDRFPDSSIGLLHVDGNHSEALSYKDVTLYLPKVASGGVIFFDDVWWNDGQEMPTTRRAIMHLLDHCTRVDMVGDCMILRKQ